MQASTAHGQQRHPLQPPQTHVGKVSRIISDISRQRPPAFEGSTKPADIVHLLEHFEKLFNMVGCPEENKVVVVSYYLNKGTHSWWLYVKPTDGICNWDDFKTPMLERYYWDPILETKLSELLNLNPSDEDDVLSIARTFQELLLFVSLIRFKYFNKRLKSRMRMQLLNHHSRCCPSLLGKLLSLSLH